MALRCDVCGNEYDLAFELIAADGTRYVFDSLECAIHRIAPACAHCGCKVIGHGIDSDRGRFCCAHCARQAGVTGAADRVGDLPEQRPLVG
jgi:hypothetical protein